MATILASSAPRGKGGWLLRHPPNILNDGTITYDAESQSKTAAGVTYICAQPVVLQFETEAVPSGPL
jgi:hypothetical protein